jgi:nucleoid DNA-binding protein
VNSQQVATEIADRCGLESQLVERILETMTQVVTALVAQGEPVVIAELAKFTKVQRPARVGRDPVTGRKIALPATSKVRFTPTQQFKNAVISGLPAARTRKLPEGRQDFIDAHLVSNSISQTGHKGQIPDKRASPRGTKRNRLSKEEIYRMFPVPKVRSQPLSEQERYEARLRKKVGPVQQPDDQF